MLHLQDIFFHLLLILDRKSTCLNSSHANISYAVFCLKKVNRMSEGVVNFMRALFQEGILSKNQSYEFSLLEVPMYEDIYKNFFFNDGAPTEFYPLSPDNDFTI